MPLIASSAGAIIYSVLLTKFSVTGHYEVHPGILRNKIRTQQSTWMEMAEDGSSAALALENGGSVAALGGGVWRRLKIVAALGGGGRRRTCHGGIGVSVIKAKGLLFQRRHQRWQRWQERMHPMQGTYVGSNGKEIGISRWWWWWWQCRYDVSVDEARARGRWRRSSTGKARAMWWWRHGRSEEGEVKWLGEGARWWSTQAGQKVCNGGTGLK